MSALILCGLAYARARARLRLGPPLERPAARAAMAAANRAHIAAANGAPRAAAKWMARSAQALKAGGAA